MVDVNRVSKIYSGKVAVRDVSFRVRPGSIFGLLGPNGAGKTSTIRMINAITRPDSGEIRIFGEDPEKQRGRIGYMPEERGLYRKLPVRTQLEYLGALKGMPTDKLRTSINYWLDLFEIRSWEKKKTNELSKGMAQKLQFIVTVLHDPDLLILDEPLSGLDPLNAAIINDLLFEMRKKGKIIILSTHRMEQVEQLCDDIALMSEGRIVLEGNLRDIKKRSGRTLIALRFLGDSGIIGLLPPSVTVLEEGQNEALIELQNSSEAKPLMLHLAEAVELTKWEVVEPPLRELYLDAVRSAETKRPPYVQANSTTNFSAAL